VVSWTRGRLLVASPDLTDPNFARRVVLMLTHDEGGALGIVLNDPLDVAIAEVLDEWNEHAAEPACLYRGGPVQPDGAIALGRGAAVDEHIVDGFGPVDLDGDRSSAQDVRVFVGYAGWGPGQLEGELARADWFVVDAHGDDVVTHSPSTLWRDVLRRQPGRLSMFSLAPMDPSVN
jgi:putative transcriptional regulator